MCSGRGVQGAFGNTPLRLTSDSGVGHGFPEEVPLELGLEGE